MIAFEVQRHKGDILQLTIHEASIDELDDDPGSQDGSTTDDIVIAPDCQTIQLRRERMNVGNGRVYTVSLSVTDGSGTYPAAYIVAVPRWPWGWYSNVVDDGPSYVAVGNCGGEGCPDEIPYNGIDDVCDPTTLDDDLDGDTYNQAEDCDDMNATVHPGATEICDNDIDDDGDGDIESFNRPDKMSGDSTVHQKYPCFYYPQLGLIK